jgi:hypothetical protein
MNIEPITAAIAMRKTDLRLVFLNFMPQSITE